MVLQVQIYCGKSEILSPDSQYFGCAFPNGRLFRYWSCFVYGQCLKLCIAGKKVNIALDIYLWNFTFQSYR